MTVREALVATLRGIATDFDVFALMVLAALLYGVYYPAPYAHQHPVGVLRGEVQVVDGNDGQFVAAFDFFAHKLQHFHLVAEVEGGGGLVENQDARFPDEHLRDGDELALAAGHVGDHAIRQCCDAQAAHHASGGLDRVVAVTDPANVASRRVTERLGMTHLGRTERYYDASLELFVARSDRSA